MPESDELIEMRCRACGVLLGYRRRLGPFVFWCSEPCADTIMAKSERDVILDEVTIELYLAGIGIIDVSRFAKTPYTRLQQVLYRRGIALNRPPKKVSA
jgi:hypothetical protein